MEKPFKPIVIVEQNEMGAMSKTSTPRNPNLGFPALPRQRSPPNTIQIVWFPPFGTPPPHPVDSINKLESGRQEGSHHCFMITPVA